MRTTHPLLLETFCPSLSSAIVSHCRIPKIRVRIDKPKAVMWTSTTAVEITRNKNFFSDLSPSPRSGLSTTPRSDSTTARSTDANGASVGSQRNHIAYIAFGSNVGNRSSHIKRALAYLDKPESLEASTTVAFSPGLLQSEACRLIDTSFLYESEPMYVLQQDRFLNGVCKVMRTIVGAILHIHTDCVFALISGGDITFPLVSACFP